MKCRVLLSIIIPVYNVEKYINECFQSIIKQNFNGDNIEVICIDDGSTDRSGIICDEYAGAYKNFMVVHKKNGGVSSARNLGLKIANGQYIAWIDPDDYISNNWYREISKYLNQQNDVILFDYTILKHNRCIKKNFGELSQYVKNDEILKELVIDQKLQSQLWQKVIKKDLFQGIAFPENINCMEDYAVLHKVFLKAKTIYYLSENLYYYRVRDNSLVTDVNIYKSYNCYLIAKERYDYLSTKNIKVSKIGFLIQALGVCDQYYSSKSNEKKLYYNLYIVCKNDIKNHMLYILSSNECNNILRIKFILCYIGVFYYCKKIYRLIREKIK